MNLIFGSVTIRSPLESFQNSYLIADYFAGQNGPPAGASPCGIYYRMVATITAQRYCRNKISLYRLTLLYKYP